MSDTLEVPAPQPDAEPQQSVQTHCYHCRLPLPQEGNYRLTINGRERLMCCPGCVAAAKIIVDGKLTHYYDYRDVCDTADTVVDSTAARQAQSREFQAWARPEYKARYCIDTSEGCEAELIISGIRCAACVWLLEKLLGEQPGINRVNVNLANHRCYVRFDSQVVDIEQIFTLIASLGYQPFPYVASVEESLYQEERRSMLKALGVSAIAVMQVMMFTIALYAGAFEGIEPVYRSLLRYSSLLVVTPVVLYSARFFYISAWRDLKNKRAGMDLPVSLAIIAAYFASLLHTVWREGEVYFESVSMFVFFLLLSRFIELTARRQQAASSNELVSVFPDYAVRVEGDNTQTVLLSELAIGDRLLVENGATVPADGVVIEGETLVDESAFTGESLPLARKPDDPVFGGSLNVQNPFEYRVAALPDNSLLSSMVRLTERAAAEKPPLALLADKIAGYFVMTVLVAASAAWGYWEWHNSDDALRVLLAVLVVSCPCALSLATPVALAVGNKSLMLRGLMPTTGRLLTGLSQVDTVLFDKTGTLTDGRMALKSIRSESAKTQEQLLSIAATMEQGVNHPLAKVLRSAARQRGAGESVPAFDRVEVVQGGGVKAWCDGTEYRLGSRAFIFDSEAAQTGDILTEVKGIEVYLAENNRVLGCFLFSDVPKSDAAETVAALKSLKLDIHMISGDGEGNCATVAQSLGIEQYRSAMSPEGKVTYVKKLADQGRKVLMVGDGINDAAALKQAHVSVAINDASEFVRAKTDGVMLNAKLSGVLKGLRLAHKTKAIVAENILWALLYNLSALPMAAMGLIPPWLAALGMSLSSLIVVMNSWRISFYRGGQRA